MGKRGNGEGSIRHNEHRGRWEGRVTVARDQAGQPVRRMVTGRTRAEVLGRIREMQNATDAGQDPAPRTLTVAKFLDQWLTDVLPGSVAPTTEVNYGNVVKLYLKPHLGQKRLTTLQARDVAAMLTKMEKDGSAPNTRRLARSVLRRALRWAEQEGTVARNVAALANGVKVGSSEGRSLTPDQARRLLASLDGEPLEAAFTVALALGLRRGELLGLAWDDLTLDATPPKLTVRRSMKRLSGRSLVVDETKTPRSRRTVHLPAPVAESLRAHRQRQLAQRLQLGPSWPATPCGYDLVFRTPLGTAVDPDNFRQLCYRVTEAAGLGRWSPHELRHSAASLLIAQGVPLKLVSELLGHASIRITSDVYGHLFDEAGAVAADAMTAALWS